MERAGRSSKIPAVAPPKEASPGIKNRNTYAGQCLLRVTVGCQKHGPYPWMQQRDSNDAPATINRRLTAQSPEAGRPTVRLSLAAPWSTDALIAGSRIVNGAFSSSVDIPTNICLQVHAVGSLWHRGNNGTRRSMSGNVHRLLYPFKDPGIVCERSDLLWEPFNRSEGCPRLSC